MSTTPIVEPYLEGVLTPELRRLLDEAREEELAREEDLGEVQARIHDLEHALDVRRLLDVRAITVKQPWAWAIAHGGKTVENRSQGTRYRGRLLIHAGLAWSQRGAEDPRVLDAWPGRHDLSGPRAVDRDALPTGAVIAVAQLVDSHPDAGCCRPWGESSYTEAGGRLRTAVHHLVLEDVVPLAEPVPARGALGLWRPPAELVTAALDGDVDMASLRPRTS